jgi:toxin ParE1/3/4
VSIKYKVFITAHAQEDLERIFHFIGENNPKNATDFVMEIEHKADSLSFLPERRPFINENDYFGTSYRHPVFKNYRVIYRISETTVYILRIVHGAQIFGI